MLQSNVLMRQPSAARSRDAIVHDYLMDWMLIFWVESCLSDEFMEVNMRIGSAVGIAFASEPRASASGDGSRGGVERPTESASAAAGEPPATTTMPPNAQKLQTKGVWTLPLSQIL